MDKQKKKALVMAAIAAGVLLVCAIAIGAFFIGKNSNGIQKGDSNSSETEQTQEGEITTEITDELPIDDSVKVKLVSGDSWGTAGSFSTKYDVVIENTGSKELVSWKVKIPVDTAANIDNFWNCNIETVTEESKKYFVLTPVDYNKIISANAVSKDIGFIVTFPTDVKLVECAIETTVEASKEVAEETTAAISQTESEKTSQKAETNSTESLQIKDNLPASGVNGGLRVSGTKLVDSTGTQVQLKGLSTHGISWFPDYVNEAAFKTFRDDWGANVMRIAMYPDEYAGYLNGGDKQKLEKLIDDGVRYATNLNMYIIIDWHILAVNPNKHKNEAIAFFDKMSKKYADNNRVIYEICNEPTNSDWNSQIKPYAEDVISAIRKNDSDALILVGTNTWSQDVDAVIGNKLSDSNVMYVLHFYAGTHKDSLRNKLTKALNAGVPIFVSECSICDASGNGGIDYESANAWLKLLNDNRISFVAWNVSNKAETSAVIKSSCNKLSGWSVDDLSDTGRWFRTAIKGE